MIASLEIFLAKWGLRILLATTLVTSIWYHGYTKGREGVTTKMAEKALKEERKAAKVGVARASKDAREIAAEATESDRLRREYDNQPGNADPLNCISPDQRRVLAETINGK